MSEGNQPLAESLVASGIAKSRFDMVRDRLDQLDAAISNRLDQIGTSVDDGRVRTAQAFVVTVLMALAVTAVAAFLVRRWIMVPLSSLTAAVRRIRSGCRPPSPPRGLPSSGRSRPRSTRCSGRSHSSVTTRSEHARRSSRARSSPCRCAPSSPSDLGDYPDGWTMAAGLRAAEGVVAGDCYDVSLDLADHHRHRRARHRGSRRPERSRRAQVQGAAEGRAPFRPRAGRGGVVAERAGAWPRRALPHRVRRGPRHRRAAEAPTRTRATPTRSWRREHRSSGWGRQGPIVGPVRHDVADRVDGRRARRQAHHLHRRPRRSPRPRSSLLRRDPPHRPAPGPRLPRGAAGRRPHPLATSTTSTRGDSPTTSPSSSPAAPGPTM